MIPSPAAADPASKDSSPKSKGHIKEDPETRATRRELKQSSISDPSPGDMPAGARPDTPADDVQDDDSIKDSVLSPKKKRAHDQLDKDTNDEDNDATSTTSTDSAKDRATRLEPEKKRHRDGENNDEKTNQAKESDESSAKETQTSASAFAASGFSKLAAGSSGFASFGASKGSAFGSAAPTKLSSFASPLSSGTPQPAAAPKLTFGGAAAAPSPFGNLSNGKASGFGIAFSGGGSAFGSGAKLGTFAAPGAKSLENLKPAKAFGAPDSDAEEDSADEEEDDKDADSQPDVERAASPEKESEEKKKLRLQKVDNGETGEATIVSVRAKVFYHDKETGWKERGAGMLKINVPESCVEFDNAGLPIPGSFDASGLNDNDDEESSSQIPKVVRLILRQDQTHRVILNTVVLAATKFEEKASLKSVVILFTAFEGPDAKPVNISVKMTAANAKIFMNEMSTVQKELRDR